MFYKICIFLSLFFFIKACSIAQSGISSEEINFILESHNSLREGFALGKYLIDNTVFMASKMNEFHWDTNLQFLAQQEADLCEEEWEEKHHLYFDPNIGTNYYSKYANTFYEGLNIQKAIDYWFKKGENVTRREIENFEINNKNEYFAHVLFESSKKIGCGVSKLFTGVMYKIDLVCKYSPILNQNEAILIHEGYPCTACPFGCSEDWNGLCNSSPKK